ncbi:MAG: hypothetical protein Q9P01_02030 [Anaerolineae bacterium]|nr:hypothetical protein [Anaerolineae bacterium]MDQ7033638.1 hypothetical protein [Anaerolineae bacterium]
MPDTEQFFADMQGENRQAALLVAQVGAAPNEIQLITQVAELDESVEGLRPIRSYIIRVLGALEHQVVNLGTTVAEVTIETDHPLLYQYTQKPTAVFFRGEVKKPDALTTDIAQAHATTFFPWRHFPDYLNTEQPLSTLFESGGGLIGNMPEALANRIVKVLEHHGLEHKITQDTPYIQLHDNPALLQTQLKVLLVGGSYFVTYAFSIQEMRGKQKSENE